MDTTKARNGVADGFPDPRPNAHIESNTENPHAAVDLSLIHI